MNDTFTASIINCNTPDKYGRIYPTDVIQKAIDKIDYSLLGVLGVSEGMEIPLGDVAFIVSNLAINGDDILIGDVRVLNTQKGYQMKTILKDLEFKPAGTGICDKDGKVSEYRLLYISAILKE